jgi:membrane protease YdiL (CAAX protease family)
MPESRAVPGEAPHATLFEACLIVLILFGTFIAASLDAAMRWRPGTAGGFSDASFAYTLANELVLAAMAILVLWARRYPLHLLYPRPSARGVFEAALLGIGAVLAHRLLTLLLPQPDTNPIDEMLAATVVSWSGTLPLMVVNGIYEEVFLLAYLMRGLRRYGASTALGIALFVRMLYHTYQGPHALVSVMAVGLIFGLYYQRTGRLFPVVLAHIAIDVFAFLGPGS